MIISETFAIKIYGHDWKSRNVVGEKLSVDGKYDYTVSGVFKDIPEKSHFHSNVFAADQFSDIQKVYTYVRIKDNATPAQLTLKFKKAFSMRDWFLRGKYTSLELQPVKDIHLYSTLNEENDNHGTIGNVFALALIGVFMLIICIINFANLSIANSTTRLKEVSVRKALGGSKLQLFIQFLVEPIVITAVAAIISVALVYMLLPSFNSAFSKSLSFSSVASMYGACGIGMATLVIGFVAGLYPAAFLSLPAKHKIDTKGGWFRDGLLIFQFALSAAVIAITIITSQQVDLIQNKDLGYEKDKVVILENITMLGGLPEIISFKQELLRSKGIEDASISGYTPAQNLWRTVRQTFVGKDPLNSESQPATWLSIDHGFLPTLSIELLEGKNFSDDRDLEKQNILLNETAANQFHLTADQDGALNKEISFIQEGTNEIKSYRVIGVVKDFNFGSLHEPIKPMIMAYSIHRYEMILRLASVDTQAAMNEIVQLWKRSTPGVPIGYTFLEDRYAQAHDKDVSAGKIFSIFSILNILVACFGLFGLVSYATKRRTKEIGIRKVLGASVWAIVTIVSNKFVRLIAAAFLISLPVAWLMAQRWLDTFAFKVQISIWVFLTTGLVVFLMSMLTIGYISMKAASANPVESLKYE
jgi:putative ABC transport system permease protein